MVYPNLDCDRHDKDHILTQWDSEALERLLLWSRRGLTGHAHFVGEDRVSSRKRCQHASSVYGRLPLRRDPVGGVVCDFFPAILRNDPMGAARKLLEVRRRSFVL